MDSSDVPQIKVITLPDILRPETPACSVRFYRHQAADAPVRSMISFTANAVSLVICGRKRLQQGSHSLELPAGGGLLFRRGQCLSTDIAVAGKPYRSLLAFFGDDELTAFRKRYNVPAGTARVRDDFARFTISPQLSALRDVLADGPVNPADFSPAMRTVKLEELLLLILEANGPAAFDLFNAPVAPAPDARLRCVMDAHWQNGLSQEELAFLCHMSLSTFKRRFQAVYDMSPGQWLHRRRLDYAAHLLKVERRKASDIYFDVGFATLSSFTQSFKSHYGVTPKAYQTSIPSPRLRGEG
ncbi:MULTISPECIES: AraC family transcriptional regulator [Asticcacaulis]|uniref:helix-turn-helix domain-containing protein n=1 Tax=Asticcacaulis TaxID=76890 RepID=UPI001AE6EFD5|nr:AraC family transcriptional regulator [Asticcacaulis sp. BE141]MBP2161778.1 AraC-like DNA-binding protein [Asticcacaulis solisilvae]MDR6802824.1 AraC-like DNA-binding protein [Asticcacaulis sp. BE141]